MDIGIALIVLGSTPDTLEQIYKFTPRLNVVRVSLGILRQRSQAVRLPDIDMKRLRRKGA